MNISTIIPYLCTPKNKFGLTDYITLAFRDDPPPSPSELILDDHQEPVQGNLGQRNCTHLTAASQNKKNVIYDIR